MAVAVGVGVAVGVAVGVTVGVVVGVTVGVAVGSGGQLAGGVGITTPPPICGHLLNGFHDELWSTPSTTMYHGQLLPMGESHRALMREQMLAHASAAVQ